MLRKAIILATSAAHHFAKNLPPATFLYEKCPLRVRLPHDISKESKKPQFIVLFLVEMRGVEPLSKSPAAKLSTSVVNSLNFALFVAY